MPELPKATRYSTIFKTFSSDIEKLSSKWGMFGRSFNEIGTAISGRARDIKRDLQTTHSLAASLKGSDSIWKRLYSAKASIKSLTIDIDTLYLKVDKDSFNAKRWLSQVEKDIQNGTTHPN